MKVIVNVDDGGLHPAVRRAVVALSASGLVTSCSLMANGPDLDEAAAMQGVGLGVHLNILRGIPTCPAQEITSLVNENGLFLGDYGKLFFRYLSGRVKLQQVEKEWSAQVERILDLGIRPSHVDSEKHIHAWPGLTEVAARVAVKHGIKWMRHPVECSALSRMDKGGLRTKFLNVCGLFHSRPRDVSWPDTVWGIADQGESLRPDLFHAYVTEYRKNHGSLDLVEICCHPGLSQAGDPSIPAEYGAMRVAGQWLTEFDRLSDPAWKDVIKELGAELVPFGG